MSYPILTMPDVPKVETVLINRPNERALGAARAAQGPTAAAMRRDRQAASPSGVNAAHGAPAGRGCERIGDGGRRRPLRGPRRHRARVRSAG